MRIKIILVLVLLLTGLQAQNFDATGLALGGAYGAMSRGVDAITWNPANLALPRATFTELNFLALNLNLANTSLSIDDYERYFTEAGHEGFWDDEEKENILNLIPDDGLSIKSDFNINMLGVAVGNYGFSIQAFGNILATAPKSPFEFALKGNLRQEYNFEDIYLQGFSAIKVSLSAAHNIDIKKYFDTFAVGVNINYLRGLAIAQILDARGSFYTGDNSIHSNLYLKTRGGYAGDGFSLDLGAAGIIEKKWSVGLSLKNIFGTISWKGTGPTGINNPVGSRIFTVTVDSTEYAEDPENFEAQSSDSGYIADDFSTSLPVVLHISVAYELNEKLTLGLDLEQAYSDGMGFTDQGQISVGAQYLALPFLPVRSGMSFGGKWGFALGLGFGLHFPVFEFDLAYSMHRAAWPTLSTGFSTAMNFKFVF
jgi:hypothetical protein